MFQKNFQTTFLSNFLIYSNTAGLEAFTVTIFEKYNRNLLNVECN